VMGNAIAGLLGRLSIFSSLPLREIGVEFISPRYFFEFFISETPDELIGEMPSFGWLYVVIGIAYLAVIVYVLYRFRFLEQLRRGWAESRQRQALAKMAKAERRLKLRAAEAEAEGVRYEAFQALREGNRAFDEGRFDDALAAYDEASAATPPLSAARVGRGAALGRLGRHGEAQEAFEEALSLEPANAEALVNLGLTTLSSGDEETAREAFARAVDADEACARGHFGLAVVAAANGDKGDLLAHLKRALRLSPALFDAAQSEPAFATLADDGHLEALLTSSTTQTSAKPL
jgi:tetratricopeptide (TPR) repeat protein